MANLNDYVLGYEQQHQFAVLAGFTKQSILFEHLSTGDLQNFIYIFGLIGCAYLFLNPNMWKATILAPWFLFLLIFQSGKLADPLFFTTFDLTSGGLGNSYLSCAAIPEGTSPGVHVDASGEVVNKCVQGGGGMSSNLSGAKNPEDKIYVGGLREYMEDSSGDVIAYVPTGITSINRRLKDVSTPLSSINAYTPQLVIIDALVRARTVVTDSLLDGRMNKIIGAQGAAIRAMKTFQLHDQRPYLESLMFSAACSKFENSGEIAFLSPNSAKKLHKDEYQAMTNYNLSVEDVLMAQQMYDRLIRSKDDDLVRRMRTYGIRPPVISVTDPDDLPLEINIDRINAVAGPFVGSLMSDEPSINNLFGLLSDPGAYALNSRDDFESFLYHSPFLRTVFYEAGSSWWSSSPTTAPEDEEGFESAFSMRLQAFNKYMGDSLGADAAEGLLKMLSTVKVNVDNRVNFGSADYVPYRMDADPNDPAGAGGGNAYSTLQSITSSYSTVSGVEGRTCADYHEYVYELQSNAIRYQVALYGALATALDPEQILTTNKALNFIAEEMPGCLELSNLGSAATFVAGGGAVGSAIKWGTVKASTALVGGSGLMFHDILQLGNTGGTFALAQESADCNMDALSDFVINTSMNQTQIQRMALDQRAAEGENVYMDDGISSRVRQIGAKIGSELFETGLPQQIYNAFNGFATGSFAQLMPQLVAWLTVAVIMITPFIYMMGLIAPAWGLSIFLMPIITIVYLQSVQIMYVIVQVVFDGMDTLFGAAEGNAGFAAVYDIVVGSVMTMVFILTAFMLFSLGDAGALVKQISGKADSGATIDHKEALAGGIVAATAITGVAKAGMAVPGALKGGVQGLGKMQQNLKDGSLNPVKGLQNNFNKGRMSAIESRKTVDGSDVRQKERELRRDAQFAEHRNQKLQISSDAQAVVKNAGEFGSGFKGTDPATGRAFDLGTAADKVVGNIHRNDKLNDKQKEKAIIALDKAVQEHKVTEKAIQNSNGSVTQEIPSQVFKDVAKALNMETKDLFDSKDIQMNGSKASIFLKQPSVAAKKKSPGKNRRKKNKGKA